MRFDILTIFPELFEPFVTASIVGRGQETGLLDIAVHNLRDYTTDKHRTVDDTPYGGGPGMVMKIEPIDKAIGSINDQFPMTNDQRRRTVVLSARGQQLTQAKVEEYARLDHMILICGRYEGIDQRVVDHLADEELSIGPYVLAGGEAAALVVLETVSRLVPGVVGNPASLEEESYCYTQPRTTGEAERSASQIEYPQYTKPAIYNKWKVPEVLLSGDHAAIRSWREERRRKR